MIDVKTRHEYWWNYLLSQAAVPDDFDRTIPKIEFSTKLGRVAGKAGTSRCEYNLNYALQEGDAYDDTVCHEVCHVFAKRIYPWSRHDSLWHYLYNVVCESRRGRYHSYKSIVRKEDRTPGMKAMKEMLRLQKKIAAAEKSKPG